jgi:hypothetical protein
MLISNMLEKFHKNSHTKSYKQNKMTNMSKSKKVHISVMLLLITFVVWNFCQLVQRIRNQHHILRFLITI